MDILYYSNFCQHSKKVIDYIAKSGLIEKIHAICIDKRSTDHTGQVFVTLENGKKIMLPPNVHSVPVLLLGKQNYSAVLGNDILDYFKPQVNEETETAQQYNGEPIGVPLSQSSAGVAIISEKFTPYDLLPDDLSAKSMSQKRPMHNYVSADHHNYKIPTPPDTYRPDKVDSSVSIDTLTEQRNSDINAGKQANPFGF
jgi:hypothetical protein